MAAPERFTNTDATPVLSPILVVDDSKAQRRLLTRTLEKWGFESVEAASGQEALDLCRVTSFDVIISDWMMPGMSGAEFCRKFRALSDAPTFFVLLTAQTEREVLAEGLESGADDFLSKPFHAVELRARLRAGQRIVQAQKALAGRNLELSKTLEELSDAYAAIERDLKGARSFQEALVPERYVSFGAMDVTLLLQSSGHVGGDLVGYFPVRDGEVAVFSVDVSGHGVASALMTARIAGYLSASSPERNIALRQAGDGYEIVPLAEVCAKLNALLLMDAESDQYLTMAIAHVKLDTGEVELCQAGHPSPVIQRAGGGTEFLELWSTPIGLIEDCEFATVSFALGAGDRLVIYSDGVTECPDGGGDLLEEEGFEEILAAHASDRGNALMDRLLDRLRQYHGGRDFPDDVSAVVVQAG